MQLSEAYLTISTSVYRPTSRFPARSRLATSPPKASRPSPRHPKMDDLADLVWQSAGVKKPAASTAQGVPLSQLASANAGQCPMAPIAHERYFWFESAVAGPTVSPSSVSAMPSMTPPPTMSTPQYSPSSISRSSTPGPGGVSALGLSGAPNGSSISGGGGDPFGNLVSFATTQQQQQHVYATVPQPQIRSNTPVGVANPSLVAAKPVAASATNKTSLGGADLSFLDSLGTGSSTTPSQQTAASSAFPAFPAPNSSFPPLAASKPSSPPTASLSSNAAAPTDPWDALLSGGGGSSTSAANSSGSQSAPSAPASTTHDVQLLDDFFGPPKPKPATPPSLQLHPRCLNPHPNRPHPAASGSAFDRGFDPVMSAEALRASGGNTELAVEMILSDTSSRRSTAASSGLQGGGAVKGGRVKEQGARAVLADVVSVVQTKIEQLNVAGAGAGAGRAAGGRYGSDERGGWGDQDQHDVPNGYRPYSDSGPTSPPPARQAAVAPAAPATAPKPGRSTCGSACSCCQGAPTPIPCTAMVWEEVQHHKTLGNDAYKRGQYHDAVAEYAKAISLLPANHLALIPLYNNRAAAELKTGEYKECVADTEAVYAVVSYYGGVQGDDKVVDVASDTTVTYADCIKALLRQAAALEAMEKYQQAKDVYAGVVAQDTRNKVAMDGMARCSRALAPKPADKPDPPAPAPVATAHGTHEVAQSAAVQEMRAAGKLAEAEADKAFEIKDEIDARVLAWKKGKETNLRALLSSLDTIVWPQLGLASPALSELITPQQVKIKYMKAIAKLHPDKLKTDDVAHKMVANAAFAALNEAWDAFRAQNGM
ncbi:hypothetical protein BCR44DRAFT_1426780 [Catenaria anguillulae PL171]|uniref:J domain-containing protein n=1 Tax=Catenaria anguillulae PL171 TaxID=765915 RepID=A0A1Y2I0R2_9FUNG|nr:hypothetical protein BCR44DRAFT_1426780 [Catenaria anguillulae PL171]